MIGFKKKLFSSLHPACMDCLSSTTLPYTDHRNCLPVICALCSEALILSLCQVIAHNYGRDAMLHLNASLFRDLSSLACKKLQTASTQIPHRDTCQKELIAEKSSTS